MTNKDLLDKKFFVKESIDIFIEMMPEGNKNILSIL